MAEICCGTLRGVFANFLMNPYDFDEVGTKQNPPPGERIDEDAWGPEDYQGYSLLRSVRIS